MNLPFWNKSLLISIISILICSTSYANENTFDRAKEFKSNGKYDEAIEMYTKLLDQLELIPNS